MKVTKSLLIGLALLLATSAFAANKGSLSFTDTVSVGGTQLKPGNYKVAWEGSGPSVELSIMKGKDVVAKTSARMVERDKASSSDAAVINNNGDGSKSLSEIRFAGKKYAIAVGGAEAAQAEASEANK
jgi:hypothetical protein